MLLSSPVAAAAPDPLDLFDLLDLPSLTFDPADPLRLRATIEDARRRSGARAVVDLLVAALTRRTIRSDAEIEAYVDELKSACRQTRRFRDAIPVFQRIATLNPARRHEMTAELAVIHGHCGEAAKGVVLLETAYRGQRRLAARRRSFAFCLTGEVAAIVLRQPELARALADLGRTIPATALASTVDLGAVEVQYDLVPAVPDQLAETGPAVPDQVTDFGPPVETSRPRTGRSGRPRLRLVASAA